MLQTSQSYGSYASLASDGSHFSQGNIHDFEQSEGSDAPFETTSIKLRRSTVLTKSIINKISSSIKVFKPSKSLQMITSRSLQNFVDEDDQQSTKPSAEIDLVISGGGLKAYFICGCVAILQSQLNAHNIDIGRVSGAR
jgi:hypothetical protein